jgi:hypothetical protein
MGERVLLLDCFCARAKEDRMGAVDVAIFTEQGGHRLVIDVMGASLQTPPVEHLAFYVGIGALVGIGMVEWPIAAALAVGHILIDATNRPGLKALGVALEEA